MANKLVFNPFIKGNFDFVNDDSLTIPTTRVLYVDNQRLDTYTEDGTILYPYKSIQAAIDNVPGELCTIKINPSQYVEDLLIDAKSNIQLEGYSVVDQTRVTIDGSIEITNCTRVGLKGLLIRKVGMTALDIHDTEGRIYLDNCTISGDVDFAENSNWVVMDSCDMAGSINTYPHSSPLSIYIKHNINTTTNINMTSPNVNFTLSQCYGIGHILHTEGNLLVDGCERIRQVSGVSIESTANTGILSLIGVNFQQSDLSHGRINKTGSCDYIISSCNRNPSLDTLTGTRANYAQPSVDIEFNNLVSGLSSSNVQDAIDELSSSIPVDFVSIFNDTTSWGSPVGSYYYQTILATTHNKGLNPMCSIYELVAGEYEQVMTDRLAIDSLGNVTFRVLVSPDLRFNGKIIIK